MMERYVQWQLFLARHRGAVGIGLLLFVLFSVGLGRRMRLNEDFTDVLPVSDSLIAEQLDVLKHIRQAERLYIDVGVASNNPADLADAAAQMTAKLRAIPQLSEVRGELDLADMGAAYGELQAQLPALLDAADWRGVESNLAPAAIEKRLAYFKRAMMQPQGVMYKNIAQADPLGISDSVSLRLRALQAGVGDARIVEGRITSGDGRHVLINATPEFRSSETGKSRPLIAAVLAAARAVETNFPPGEVRVAVTGAHRAALDNAITIQRDATRASVLTTVLVAALMMLACRRRWLALLGLTPVLFGAAGTMIVLYLTQNLVSAVALGCGSMIIGVAVDYGLYVVYLLDDAPATTRETLARRVAGIIPALAFGALTTMAAFFVMFLSPVSGHRQLGLFGASGVGLAALGAIFILPVYIPVQATPEIRPLPLTAFIGRLIGWLKEHRTTVCVALIFLSLSCANGLRKIRFDGDLARLNGETPATQQDEKIIRDTWGKTLSLTTVVVSGATREEAEARNERVLAALNQLRPQHLFDTVSSVAPLTPSPATRAAHAAAWRNFWTPERQTEARSNLTAVAQKLGFRMEAFEPFLQRLGAAQFPSEPVNSALDRLAADFWNRADGRVYVTTLVKVLDAANFPRIHEAIHAAVPEASLLNWTALSDEITRIAQHALPVFGGLVVLSNALLLFLLLGRLELVAVAVLPMLIGMFWTLGTLGMMNVPIDVANFVFVIFVVGVGGDYSLFLLLGELEPLRGRGGHSASTGGAVTMCALMALLGTGVLIFARHPALYSVGVTALLGISYSLLATLCLLPLGVRWLSVPINLLPPLPTGGVGETRRGVARLYRLQGAYVSQFAWWKLRVDPLFPAVDAVVPPEGEVLDLGCGFGLMAHWLTFTQTERRVRGLDFDGRKIRAAQVTAEVNPRVSFQRADLLALPEFPPCDTALLCDVLHYFSPAQKKEILIKVRRALIPGGLLVIRDAMAAKTSAHRKTAAAEKWAVRLGQNRTGHGLHFEDEAAHRRLLEETGFRNIAAGQNAGLGSNILLTARKPAVDRANPL